MGKIKELCSIGLFPEHKSIIVSAIEKGYILLDCPLKSMEEIVAFRGKAENLVYIAAQYARNNLRPIDSINALKGLILSVLLHFQSPDEIISNRDDELCIRLMRRANAGMTQIVIGEDSRHTDFHSALWDVYTN